MQTFAVLAVVIIDYCVMMLLVFADFAQAQPQMAQARLAPGERR